MSMISSNDELSDSQVGGTLIGGDMYGYYLVLRGVLGSRP